MHIVPGFVIREIAGDIVAVPSGESARRLSGIIALNESCRFLFETLANEQTEESLADAFFSVYDVDKDTAQKDVSSFLSFLRENNLLIESPSTSD